MRGTLRERTFLASMANTLTDNIILVSSECRRTDTGSPRVTMGVALATVRQTARGALPFRAVNKRESPDFDPGMQRHHLLPRQLLSHRCLGPLFDVIGRERLGFEDFRANGLLLPASDSAALRIGLPMHRGPHRDYNQLVMERVGQVEERWANLRGRAPEVALDEAVQRITLLQRALRRRLLNPRRKPFRLNRFDPIGQDVNFAEIDAMVDMLWPETCPDAGIEQAFNPADMGVIAPGDGRGARSAFSF